MTKFVDVDSAIKMIKNGSTIAVNGFMGVAYPEQLAVALENSFIKTGEPKDLTLVFSAGQGDGKSKGLNHFAHPKFLKRTIGSHYGMAPRLGSMALGNEIEAYSIPQGVITQLYRDIAAHRPGLVTHVGLNTFVDPRIEGGKLNSKTKKDIVELIYLQGKPWLFFKAFPIDVGLIRATTADEQGNLSFEKELAHLEALPIAQAAKNCEGIVIAQVERVSVAGGMDPRLVRVPGFLVDAIVVSNPQYHMQTLTEDYNPAYTGDIRVPVEQYISEPLPLNAEKVILRRAAKELFPGAVVNLGYRLPVDIPRITVEENIEKYINYTVELGAIGGIPLGGLSFGASINPDLVVEQPSQFDFYNGKGLDVAFLGMAEVDPLGNVNVSKFKDRLPGCGGFIEISQGAKKVVFCGTFTANNLTTKVKDGKLEIVKEGTFKKFLNEIEHLTFSGNYALKKSQKVVYITERAVFELIEEGLALKEVAPGIDVEKDILQYMEFIPIVEEIREMDKRIFLNSPMGLYDDYPI